MKRLIRVFRLAIGVLILAIQVGLSAIVVIGYTFCLTIKEMGRSNARA